MMQGGAHGIGDDGEALGQCFEQRAGARVPELWRLQPEQQQKVPLLLRHTHARHLCVVCVGRL
jgi:hypothetical protein